MNSFSEQLDELAVVLDQLDTPIFILEPSVTGEPTYVLLNATLLGNLKRSPDQLIGKTSAQIYPGKFGELAYQYHCECMKTKEKMSYELAFQLETKELHFRTTLSPDLSPSLVPIVG